MLNNGTLPFCGDTGAGEPLLIVDHPWETGVEAASPSGENAGIAEGDGEKLQPEAYTNIMIVVLLLSKKREKCRNPTIKTKAYQLGEEKLLKRFGKKIFHKGFRDEPITQIYKGKREREKSDKGDNPTNINRSLKTEEFYPHLQIIEFSRINIGSIDRKMRTNSTAKKLFKVQEKPQ